MAYNLDNYETVETRLERFWEKYPNGRTNTQVLEKTESSILMIASIYAERNDLNPIATGIAEEVKSSSELTADVIKLGTKNFSREILFYCQSKSECSYIEAREQFTRRVLESADYYNGHIQVRVHGSHIINKL